MWLLKTILSIVIALSVPIATLGQRMPVQGSKRKAAASNPSVYLSFVRLGNREPVHTDESGKRVWLRLHNNTRWSLVLNAYGAGGRVFATGKEEEVGMFYGVEEFHPRSEVMISEAPRYPMAVPVPGSDPDWNKRPDPIPPRIEEDCPALAADWCIHLCSLITLPPGKSLVFSVPRETLCKNLRIYLLFNYSWETRNGFVVENAPEHRVYFNGTELLKVAR
jgi:hypothetical protein